jgi:hypothetical protein
LTDEIGTTEELEFIKKNKSIIDTKQRQKIAKRLI